MRFASEAIPLVAPVLIAAALVLLWGLWGRNTAAVVVSVVLAVVGLSVLAFFRDPVRQPPPGEGQVVSPADGKVMLSETMPDGGKHVAIFLSVFDVHVNRNPLSGTVRAVTRVPGTYFHAGSERATGNARVDVEAETAFGPVRWRQVSGLIARKISCPLEPGDVVKRGGEIWFDLFRFAHGCIPAASGPPHGRAWPPGESGRIRHRATSK